MIRNKSKVVLAVGAIATGTLIVGCSGGEPTLADVQQAYSKEGGFKATKIIGCKPDTPNAYRCDVDVTAGSMQAVRNTRFVKTPSGWELTYP